MIDGDVVARRVLALGEVLAHLDRPECGDAARLRTDPLLLAAVERWLQVAIECCIDVVVATGLGDLRAFARVAAAWIPD